MWHSEEYRGFKIISMVQGTHSECEVRDLKTNTRVWGRAASGLYHFSEDHALNMGREWIDGHLHRVATFLKQAIVKIEAEKYRAV